RGNPDGADRRPHRRRRSAALFDHRRTRGVRRAPHGTRGRVNQREATQDRRGWVGRTWPEDQVLAPGFLLEPGGLRDAWTFAPVGFAGQPSHASRPKVELDDGDGMDQMDRGALSAECESPRQAFFFYLRG